MTYPIVISSIQAESLLAARGEPSVLISPDLGISSVTVKLSDKGVEFPEGKRVRWQNIEQVKKAKVNCFIVEDGSVRPIQVFS
ncbi:MAG TPA: spermine synthase, partial [Ktedonobacteraceae bacterium]|nr:spermine synthase [Ktedonobacteraceae bacterium]